MKKKTLTIAIALVLVVALAVGATYALLTAKTDPVTNTFMAGKITDNDTVFTLKEHKVTQAANGTYTLTDEEGECVLLRVDEKYMDSDEYDSHYFVNFYFDPDGNFVNAYLGLAEKAT